jgi:hypothetical protein
MADMLHSISDQLSHAFEMAADKSGAKNHQNGKSYQSYYAIDQPKW